jgi:hypothetical protein
MSKRLIYALILIAATMVVLLFNRDPISVNLLVDHVRPMAALVYLFFVGLGVVIGVLLK